MLRSEYLCPPNSYVGKVTHKVTVLGGGPLGGSTFINRISVLIEETP